MNNPKARFQNVEGLQFPVNYSVIVRATTSSGEGAASEQIFEFTKRQDLDDWAPRNVTHTNLTPTSVTLIWERPLQDQDLLNYTLNVKQLDEPIKQRDKPIPSGRVVNKNETSAAVAKLLPNTLFSAKIVAGFSDDSLEGDSDLHIFQTPPSGKIISKSILNIWIL